MAALRISMIFEGRRGGIAEVRSFVVRTVCRKESIEGMLGDRSMLLKNTECSWMARAFMMASGPFLSMESQKSVPEMIMARA